MSINFNSLPTDKPFATPPKGSYYATIEKAEMKTPKDTGKKDYLNLTLGLKNSEGKSCGKIFDIISESDHELVRYKLGRFITALQINLTGNFELKDLCKIIQGKQIIVDVCDEKKKDGDNSAPRAVVDMFSGEIYYPMSEAGNVFGIGLGEADDQLDFEVNAADAADAQQTNTPNNEEY